MLLDTQALIWWLSGDALLPAKARWTIADEANDIFVSAVSAWEIATKHRLGKLLLDVDPTSLDDTLKTQGFKHLAITWRHGLAAGALPGPHRDPFDRMLMAQAMLEDFSLISNERVFDTYGVNRVW